MRLRKGMRLRMRQKMRLRKGMRLRMRQKMRLRMTVMMTGQGM